MKIKTCDDVCSLLEQLLELHQQLDERETELRRLATIPEAHDADCPVKLWGLITSATKLHFAEITNSPRPRCICRLAPFSEETQQSVAELPPAPVLPIDHISG